MFKKTMLSLLRTLLKIFGVLALLWLLLLVYVKTSPVVVLHYSADAAEPVVYFFDEPTDTVKAHIHPRESVGFHVGHNLDPDFAITVSLPLASRDGVDITPPFSRVDVYIGADTKITRTVTRHDFFARFGFD